MKLWKIERTDHVDYDEYDSAIVRARSAGHAVDLMFEDLDNSVMSCGFQRDPQNFTVTQLTEAGHSGVVIASFKAG